METFNVNYYLVKNISTRLHQLYQILLIHKTESVIRKIRWKAHFFENSKIKNVKETYKDTYQFKSI